MKDEEKKNSLKICYGSKRVFVIILGVSKVHEYVPSNKGAKYNHEI